MSALEAALDALRLTERNLSSLINARHHNAVMMIPWREEVAKAINAALKESQ